MRWKFWLSIGYYKATQTKYIDLEYLNETEESWALYTDAQQHSILNSAWEEWIEDYIEGGYDVA